MKFIRTKRDSLRALTSEVLPYEVPLPFNTAQMYGFLRRLKFNWEDESSFSVLKAKLGKAEKYWLEVLFDGIKLGRSDPDNSSRTTFHLSNGSKRDYELRHPYRYRARRNNGKKRNLAVPHPQSMLRIAKFIHEFSDTILYFSNRSNFSLRRPHQAARVAVKPSILFQDQQDNDMFMFEQFDLNYDYVSSYFAYRNFNNINRFYSSTEFRSCERKYKKLIHADIAKCFDSIYTHTISWVTNGLAASKDLGHRTENTFGGQFDRLMQYMNYAETNGIVIGPEISRIFAEIIIQEVDLRIERDLASKNLVSGIHYEIKRYVDDYFIFLTDDSRTEVVLEVIASHLSEFKLHLNDQKEQEFDTPLASHMSVAKLRLREDLSDRIKISDGIPFGSGKSHELIYLSTSKALLDYKSILIDTDLDHSELANSYLYELGRQTENSISQCRDYLSAMQSEANIDELNATHQALVKFFVSVIDIAVSIYSGAPSVSHSIKLCQLIVYALRVMQENNLGLIHTQSFRDKAFRELASQINSRQLNETLDMHELILFDCLIFLEPDITEDEIERILGDDFSFANELSTFGVLTLLRACSGSEHNKLLQKILLTRAEALIEKGSYDSTFASERAILKLCLPTLPGVSLEDLKTTTGISKGKLRHMRKAPIAPTLFAWNASDSYHQRLRLKSMQMVY